MNIRDDKHVAFALVLCFAVICIPEIRGCWVVERTQDRCVSSGHIWLAGSIHRSTYKGGSTNTYIISEYLKQLYWWCGNSRERVAWDGKANRLRVSFLRTGWIKWEFLMCRPPPGCITRKRPEITRDRCVSGGHIWLEGGIDKSVHKGTSSGSIEISRHMRELKWWCGYGHDERVAWSGGANLLRVHFKTDGTITWEFFTCEPPAECYHTRHHLSLQINLEKVTLSSPPTDNVAFGWESVFGKPADEIVANLESKQCYRRSNTREIKEGMTLLYHSVTLKSFRDQPIKFWLSEEDGGLEGKNDLSQLVTISKKKMDQMRKYLDHNPDGSIEFDDSVTVKGQNIFQEHKWFGFLAENLCINVLDFAAGPWTGFGRKLAINAASKKAIGRFQSRNIAKLYDTIKTKHAAGTLRKRDFFKAVMTYQFREGLKTLRKGIAKNAMKNIQDEIKEWALKQTRLDELNKEVKKLIEEAVRAGIIEAGGASVLTIYDEVSKRLDDFSSWFEELTGKLEFCLSEVFPPARDALYHVYFTVRKS